MKKKKDTRPWICRFGKKFKQQSGPREDCLYHVQQLKRVFTCLKDGKRCALSRFTAPEPFDPGREIGGTD